ncbi:MULTISPECIES: type II secretion system minor pseudopilin GspK [Caldimonas]|uniref:type II secretion system minor pseudopilin GspK n=1 Tax=Caldimonas TaxID=196013 RepID=UPI0004756A8B|nr:type II secretion system minor pseudopilin GspK [Caldimonas manganoxidans]GIX22801.1 MAG: type II secretion system protein K [Caldimonas sp.]
MRTAARRRPRGAALLTAMIIVTVVATLASGMLWRQWRSVQIEAAERSRAQASWILTGALDWARLILREDRRSGSVDHLSEPWATPLAEARLSTFLAVQPGDAEAAPDAFLAGRMSDLQGRFNLTNLAQAADAAQPHRQALQRLCELVHVDPSTADRLAAGFAAPPTGQDAAADRPLMPPTPQLLGWLGLDAATVQALAPYVAVLPRPTPVNLNTASREVLAAVLGVDLASADRLVQHRQRSPFRSLAEAAPLLPPGTNLSDQQVGVSSDFFEVLGQLRIDQRAVQERSLVERRGLQVVSLWRERSALVLGQGR